MTVRPAHELPRSPEPGAPLPAGSPLAFRDRGELSLRVAGGPDAAAAARRALGGLEPHVGSRMLEDVTLLVSELVTNSVRHADIGLGDGVELHASVSEGALHVDVIDAGPGFAEPRRPPRPEDGTQGGWGLYMVEKVADRWGVERRDGGTHTTVWFELDR